MKNRREFREVIMDPFLEDLGEQIIAEVAATRKESEERLKEDPTMKLIHLCECEKPLPYPRLPPGMWLSCGRSGWHRVFGVSEGGPQYSYHDHGCGNDPAEAVAESWGIFHKWAKRVIKGKCWHCNDKPDWFKNYTKEDQKGGRVPLCHVCGAKAKKKWSK